MNLSRKIAFHTLGCKLNFSETSSLAQEAIDIGYIRVDSTEIADIYVINTCSVTENADKECKYIVRQFKRKSPECKIVIIGCYAQLKPTEISEIEGVDMVLGATEKFRLIDHISRLEEQTETMVFAEDIKEIDEFVPTFSSGDRTRTFLKIQDGCDYFCTFCTIPLARGRSRSQSIQATLDTFQKAIDTGVKEIILTGVNTGDFGKSEDGKLRTEETFEHLAREIDAKFQNIRVRVSSIEPNLLTNSIIDIVSQSKVFVPHFHIPLQSGSNTILESMHRKYNAEFYKEKIDYIKSKMPYACIGVDVIVGYPEETDELFEESYQFVQNLNVDYLHVFTYSERANTRALKTDNFIPIAIRRERNKRFRILSEKLKRTFYQSEIGKTHHVLFEQDNDNGFILGYSENYIRYRLPFNPSFIDQIIPIEMTRVQPLLFAEGILKIKKTWRNWIVSQFLQVDFYLFFPNQFHLCRTI